jgi:hypothetical protein
MNLTKEYFDKKLEEQTRTLMAFAEAQTEALAGLIGETIDIPMHRRFDALDAKLDKAIKRIDSVEAKMHRLEEALHIKL